MVEPILCVWVKVKVDDSEALAAAEGLPISALVVVDGGPDDLLVVSLGEDLREDGS